MSNDPYIILGLKKHELGDNKEKKITKAYRRLAMRWHPDKNNNDKYAEEQFKKINRAYQKLIHPERLYNNTNVFTSKWSEEKFTKFTENIIDKSKKFTEWIGKMKDMDISSLTDNFIKEATRYKSFYEEVTHKEGKKIKKTDDIILNINLKLEDIYKNEKKTLNIKLNRKCRTCLGNGVTIKGICKECNGDKYRVYDKTIEFFSFEKQIILKKESNEEENCIAGDIIINIIPKEHSQYKIINNNDILHQVYFDSCIKNKEIKNKELDIEYLDGFKYNISMKDIIFNKFYKIENLGLLNQKKERGNFYIQPLLKDFYLNTKLNDSVKIKMINNK